MRLTRGRSWGLCIALCASACVPQPTGKAQPRKPALRVPDGFPARVLSVRLEDDELESIDRGAPLLSSSRDDGTWVIERLLDEPFLACVLGTLEQPGRTFAQARPYFGRAQARVRLRRDALFIVWLGDSYVVEDLSGATFDDALLRAHPERLAAVAHASPDAHPGSPDDWSYVLVNEGAIESFEIEDLALERAPEPSAPPTRPVCATR